MTQRSLLRDVAVAYYRHMQTYEQGFGTDRGDDALAGMQQIEQSVSITEHNTAWRQAPKKSQGTRR